jgi:transcriptional regulator with XRE-family HTH domain
MTSKLPIEIKNNVLRMWLEGISRNRIARILGIGKGSVSGIIQNVRFTMNDIDMLRAVAEVLFKEEVDVYTFASAINLKRKMDESNLPQDLIEKFHEDIDTISFKTGIEPKILIEKIVSILVLSINLNLPIDQANYSVEVINNRLEDLESISTNKINHINHLQGTLFTTIEAAAEFDEYKNWKVEKEELLARLEELEELNSLQELEITELKGQLKKSSFYNPKF